MSDDSEKKERHVGSTVPLERLYATMSEEAAGLYNQLITICTAFLGGTLVFFNKMFVGNVGWSLWLLFTGWAALTYPLAVLVLVRWQNVEAHRHALEYFKNHVEKEYDKAVSIPRKARIWTKSAIILMVVGLILIAVFTAINIFLKHMGGQP